MSTLHAVYLDIISVQECMLNKLDMPLVIVNYLSVPNQKAW